MALATDLSFLLKNSFSQTLVAKHTLLHWPLPCLLSSISQLKPNTGTSQSQSAAICPSCLPKAEAQNSQVSSVKRNHFYPSSHAKNKTTTTVLQPPASNVVRSAWSLKTQSSLVKKADRVHTYWPNIPLKWMGTVRNKTVPLNRSTRGQESSRDMKFQQISGWQSRLKS